MRDFDEVFSRLRQDLVEVLELEDPSCVQPESLVVDLGLNSLRAASICAVLEFDYDVVVPIEVFVRRIYVRDMVDWVCDPDSIVRASEAPMLDLPA